MSITSFVTVENPKLYSIDYLGKLRTEHNLIDGCSNEVDRD